MKFSSKLECVSKYSLKTIVLFQACSLLSVVADNSTYLAKIAGFNFNFAYAFLLLCNFIKFSVSIILAIPVLSPRLTTVFYVILASVLTIEAMISASSTQPSSTALSSMRARHGSSGNLDMSLPHSVTWRQRLRDH